MKGFAIGAALAAVLSGLTYLGLNWGSVSMAARYSPPTVQLDDH